MVGHAFIMGFLSQVSPMLLEPETFRASPGRGVEATVLSHRVCIGTASWLRSEGVDFAEAKELQHLGVVVGVEGKNHGKNHRRNTQTWQTPIVEIWDGIEMCIVYFNKSSFLYTVYKSTCILGRFNRHEHRTFRAGFYHLTSGASS